MTTKLYISGSARRGAGGWAYTLEPDGQPVQEASGGEWGGTPTRMEYAALVAGLTKVSGGAVEVVLSSDALLRTATEWMPQWKAAGWKRASGTPIRHLDLVQQVSAQVDRLAVTWTLAPGAHPVLQALRTQARDAAGEVSPPPPGPAGAPVTGTVGPSTRRLVAYTDGGCRGNPGVGGWGFVLVDTRSGAALSRRGGAPETTNNRMEMQAAIEALAALSRPQQSIEIRTDSRYLCDLATKWVNGWKKRGWKRKGNAPVKNLDLVKRVDELQHQHDVLWTWVKGHAGEPGNEFADHLTNAAMDGVSGGGDGVDEQRYPKSPILVHPG